MRSVSISGKTSSASHRRKPSEQQPKELADAMHALPQVPSRYGKEARANGSWEDGMPRTAYGVKSRVGRLKAIGNGQVPLCMAYAYALLSQGIIEP